MNFEEDLRETVEALFQDAYEIPLRPGHAPAPPGISACIHVTGTAAGTLVLTTSRGFSKALAERQLDVPSVTEADEMEIIAELANVLGGNIKSLLEGVGTLTLPVVTVGSRIVSPGGTELVSCHFDSHAGELSLSWCSNVAQPLSSRFPEPEETLQRASYPPSL